jgi:hypothetical protein
MRVSMRLLLLVGLVIAALAGCGGGSGDDDEPPPASIDIGDAPTTSTTTEGSADGELLVTGDAAANRACDLASVEEIEAKVDAGVTEMRGQTSPGAFGETLLTCTWFLDSEDIGIPSVTVQWEHPVTSWHDSVIDLYASQVDGAVATRVDGIGEAAVQQGATVEAIDHTEIVRVTVLMHAEATPVDIERATDLLEVMLRRTLA